MSFSSSNAALGSFILDDRMLNLGNCPELNASKDIQQPDSRLALASRPV